MDLEKKQKSNTYGYVGTGKSEVSKDDGSNTATSTKGKAWLWIVVVLIIAAIVFFTVRSCMISTPAGEEEPTSEVPEENTPNESEQIEETTIPQENTSESASESVSTDEVDHSISAEDNSISNKQSNSSLISDVEATAINVIRGNYGNGQARKDKLGNAYTDVQKRVNEMYRQGLVD